MSNYLGRVRRVYTGWRALPGKQLVIFDDCFVLARASALDGAFGPLVGLVIDAVDKTTNDSIPQRLRDGLTPADLVRLHADNWLLETSSITSASLRKRIHLGAWRRLTLETAAQTRTVDYEPGANPDNAVVELMQQILGDRFSRVRR